MSSKSPRINLQALKTENTSLLNKFLGENQSLTEQEIELLYQEYHQNPYVKTKINFFYLQMSQETTGKGSTCASEQELLTTMGKLAKKQNQIMSLNAKKLAEIFLSKPKS